MVSGFTHRIPETWATTQQINPSSYWIRSAANNNITKSKQEGKIVFPQCQKGTSAQLQKSDLQIDFDRILSPRCGRGLHVKPKPPRDKTVAAKKWKISADQPTERLFTLFMTSLLCLWHQNIKSTLTESDEWKSFMLCS